MRHKAPLAALLVLISAISVLGLGSPAAAIVSPFPVQGASSGTFRAIDASRNYACALNTSGELYCWGAIALSGIQASSPYVGDASGEVAAVDPINLGTGVTVQQFDLGYDHQCAVLNNGSVKCWGSNGAGQLGLGDTTTRYTSAVMGSSLSTVSLGTNLTAIAVGAGANFSCVLTSARNVKCWGDNQYGQLGRGNTSDIGDASGEMGDSLAPIDLDGSKVREMHVGYLHVCVLTTDGQVKCWGQNSQNQLGSGGSTTSNIGDAASEMGSALLPVSLPSGTVQRLFGGEYTTCVQMSSGSYCWGSGAWGERFTGNYNSAGGSGTMGSSLAQMSLGTYEDVIDYESSSLLPNAHACAVISSGTVKCVGNNTYGQLGRGNTTDFGGTTSEVGVNLAAVDLGSDDGVLDVAVADKYTCALLLTGEVKCWGANEKGQLGIGSTATIGDGAGEMGAALTPVPFANEVATSNIVAYNGVTTCATLTTGAAKCWGLNSSGQLGQGSLGNIGSGATDMANLNPISLALDRARVVYGGYSHSCAILVNHKVQCWGDNASGQLGLGDTLDRGDESGEMGSSLPYVDLGSGAQVVQLALGSAHTCALLDNGTVKCWGEGGKGQLGYDSAQDIGDGSGEMGSSLTVVNLGGATRRAVRIAAGSEFTCALLDNGTVKCWGSNTYGQLGQGDVASRGDNSSEMAALAAINLDGLVVDIAAGGYHACAILDDGGVKCWGANSSGQLGYGDVANRGDNSSEMGASLNTVYLGGMSGLLPRTAIAIATGNGHTCVITNNRAVKCWGRATNGQLGYENNTTLGDSSGEVSPTNPLAVVSLGTGRSATQLSTGSNHTCALLDNGDAKCWGLGTLGQTARATTAGNAANTMGDNLAPITVIDSNAPDATWSPASTMFLSTTYDLDFDEPVYGLDDTDFITYGTAPGCTVDVSASSSTHAIVQTTCSGDGDVETHVLSGGFADYAGNPIAFDLASATVTLDTTAPSATISTPGATVGTLNPVFTVTFDENVNGIGSTDFSVSGTATPCTITTSATSGASVNVTARCTQQGTVALSLTTSRVYDDSGNNGPASTVTSSAVTINTANPTPTMTAPSSPRSSRTLTYSVVFNQSVSGLAADDFSNLGTATCPVSVSGSGTTYTVTLSCTTDGTAILRMAADAVLGTAGTGPTTPDTAATVDIDSTGPVAEWELPSPVSSSPTVTFTLSFDEDVTVGSGDITVGGTAAPGCGTPSVSGSGSVYSVDVTCTSDGTVFLYAVANAFPDALGNNGPSTSVASNAVTIDTRPLAATLTPSISSGGLAPFSVTATFDETAFGLDSADFSFTGTATGCAANPRASTGLSIIVDITCSSSGTVVTRLASGSVTDGAGNASPAALVSSSSVTLDASIPSAEWGLIASLLADRTPEFVITFDAPVTNFTTTDLTFVTGGSSCVVSSVTTTDDMMFVIGVTCSADVASVSLRLASLSVSSIATSTSGPGSTADSATVTIDTIAPTASWGSMPGSSSTSRSLGYSLTFSETVYGIDSSDFTSTGTATGCAFTPFSSSGTTINVDALCTSDGTITPQFNNAGAAVDAAGNALAGSALIATATLIDATVPTVIWSAGSSTPGSLSASYILNFSETVSGLASGDFSNTGTATGCVFTPAAASGISISLSVACTGYGTIVATLGTLKVTDAVGNAGPSTASSAGTVTIASVAPTGLITLTPARILDTRSGSKIGAVDGTGTARTLNVNSQGGLPASGIGAVVLNVTVTGGENPRIGGGYVTVYPCAAGRPDASNLNFEADQTIPNSVIAPVDSAGNICFYVYGKAHLLADVSGYFPTSSSLTTLTPARILDTRSGSKVGAVDGTGTARTLNVNSQGGLPASGIGAVVLNVTVTGGENPRIGGGYVTVYPCAAGRPDASNLNFEADQTIPNSVIAPVDSAGNICFYVYGKAHLLADVSGYFPTSSSLTTLTPARILDTRSGSKVGAVDGTGTARTLNVNSQGGLPASGIGAVVLNVTVTGGENPRIGGGYVTVYPCAAGRPDASNLNFEADQTIPNSVIAPVDSAGNICFYVYGKAHLLADVSGYFPT